MNQIKTKGIIISDTNYGETSKILNILTPDKGIIGIISKGCRNIKSKLRSVSTKLTYGYFYLNYKENSLSTLTEVDVLNDFKNIKTNLTKIGYTSYLIDLAKQTSNQIQKEEIFNILESALIKIENGLDPAVITNIVEIKYLPFLGVEPSLDKCVKCGNTKDIITVNSDAGGYICKNCYNNEYITEEKTLKLLRMLKYVDISKIKDLNLQDKNKKEINKFLEDYYSRYTGLYLKSKDFLTQIKWKNLIFSSFYTIINNLEGGYTMQIGDCPSMKDCFSAAFGGPASCRLTQKTEEKKDFSRVQRLKEFKIHGFYGPTENYFKRFIRLTKDLVAGEVSLPNYEEKWMLFDNRGYMLSLKNTDKGLDVKQRGTEEPLDIFDLSIVGYEFFTLEKMREEGKILLRRRDNKLSKVSFFEPVTGRLAWLKNEQTKNYELKNIDTNKKIMESENYPITKIINSKYLFIVNKEEEKANSVLLNYKDSTTPEIVKRARVDINFKELLKMEEELKKEKEAKQKQRKF